MLHHHPEMLDSWLVQEFERLDLYLCLAVLEKRLSYEGSSSRSDTLDLLEVEVYQLLALNSEKGGIAEQIEATLVRLTAIRGQQAVPTSPIVSHIKAVFELDGQEWDILLTCLAPVFHDKYRRLFGFLNDNPIRCHADLGLLLRLLARTHEQRAGITRFICAHSAVRRFHLIQADQGNPMGSDFLLPCPRLVAVLSGQLSIDPELTECLRFLPDPVVAGPCSHLDPLIANLVNTFRYGSDQGSFRILLQGSKGSGRKEAAVRIAAALGLKVVELDPEALFRKDNDFYGFLDRAVRDLYLLGSVPLIANLAFFNPADPQLCACRSHLFHSLNNLFRLVFLSLDDESPLFLNESTEATHPVNVVPLNFPFPGLAERSQIWFEALKAQGLQLQELTPDRLATMFRFNRGRILEAAQLARTLRFGDLSNSTDQLLLEACRGICNHKLAEHAERVADSYSWSDLILNAQCERHLRDLLIYFKHREALFDKWGFAKRVSQKGLHVLFHGPPGTGKTMAASVIASQLKLVLYRIDLSKVISKYIGETEKNLSGIFREAHHANAILFFDEADALFGKRSEVKDAHDRFANVEISYLLLQMENYDGITILATNLLQNLDDAFTRRINFIIELPFPEKSEREQLWINMFPEQAPLDEQIDFAFLSERFPLSGGEIKNVVLNAAAYAIEAGGPIGMAQIIYSIRMEREKKGLCFMRDDFEPYAQFAEIHPLARGDSA